MAGAGKAILAASLLSAAGGCAPTLELKTPGSHLDRAHEVARRFCAAARGADPEGAARIFAEPVGEQIQRLVDAGRASEIPLTSRPPGPLCEPGRVWYLGGSRTFPEVRLQGGSDRLDLWATSGPPVFDVIYGEPVRVGGKRAKTLKEALALMLPPAPPAD